MSLPVPQSGKLTSGMRKQPFHRPVLPSRIVQPQSLTDVADELYSLAPAEFTAARDARARQMRAEGQRDVSEQIKKLTRPTASAWLVNLLVRDAADEMKRLFEIGDALHVAQRSLAGDRLRELSGQRRQVIADLLPMASRLAATARLPASAAILGEVKATLEAALADPQARAAVQSGRLTRGLAYAGLGEREPPAASARSARSRTASRARPPRPATGAARRREEADRSVREAEAGADAAAAALADAERTSAGLSDERQLARRRIDNARRELSEAEADEARLARECSKAERRLDAAARALETAVQRLRQARERAADVIPGAAP